MDFKRLTPDMLPKLRSYVERQPFRLSEFSLGFQQMWLPYARTCVAEVDGCLLIKSAYGGKTHFYYPLHLDSVQAAELSAIAQLETWCVEQGVPLVIGAIPSERLPVLVQRYGRELELSNPRMWRDYLYHLSDFVDYPGKRFAGQRNHLSKFCRCYPQAVYRPMTTEDIAVVQKFLCMYATRQYAKHSFIANEELHGSEQLLAAFDSLSLCGGIMEVDGRIVAITVGEVVGDTLVVHIEKALIEYGGVYPAIAHAFAKQVAKDGVDYINREDDAGDCGLRKSKLQYNPIQVLDKYTLIPKRIIDSLTNQPELHTDRLDLRSVADCDVHEYGKLARDLQRSRMWGWDWSADWHGEGDPRDVWFLASSRKDFVEHRELPLGIYFGEKLVGEGVFHNFSYDNMVELGVRLLPEAEHHGFATEAIRAMADYALCFWGLERVKAKCYLGNSPSKRMLEASGFQLISQDDQFFYFFKTAKN